MPIFIWLAALAIAASIPLAFWALGSERSPTKSVRVNLGQGPIETTNLREIQLQDSASERVVTPSMLALANRARSLTPSGFEERLEHRILLAGMSQEWGVERALATKVTSGIIGAIIGALLFALDPSVIRLLAWAVLAGGLFFAFDVIVNGRARERQGQIGRDLPDSLDQITICVESGLAFEAAVAQVASNSGPLANELGRMLQDIQMGLPRARAMEQLLHRTDVVDLRTFVHAFSQAQRYGIPIAHVLRVQSADMRDKRRQRAEAMAMKMPVKLVFPVVLCILPALFVVVAGPAVVRLSNTGFGG